MDSGEIEKEPRTDLAPVRDETTREDEVRPSVSEPDGSSVPSHSDVGTAAVNRPSAQRRENTSLNPGYDALINLIGEPAARGAAPPPGEEPDDTKRSPPRSLLDLYEEPSTRTVAYLQHMQSEKRWSPTEDDVNVVIEELDHLDPHLSKTRNLAVHALQRTNRRFSASYEPFFTRAVTPAFSGVRRWPPTRDDNAATTFNALAAAVRGPGSTGEPTPRSVNALIIAFILLVDRYGLPASVGVAGLAKVMRPSTQVSGDAGRRRRASIAAVAGSPDDRLQGWLDIFRPTTARALQAEREAEQARSDLQAVRDEQAQLQERVLHLEGELERAHRESAAVREEVAGTEVRLEVARVARRVDSGQLKGRMIGFLEDQVAPLLRDADKALSRDTPRVPYAQQRVEDAAHAVEKRLEWLRSSD